MSGAPDGAWAALMAAYEQRVDAARNAASHGALVVGMVGADVPAALVSAAGAAPFRLHATMSRQTSEEAVALLGAAVDPSTQSLLSQILAGDLDFLSGLVISRDCQGSLQLFYVLRELARVGRLSMPIHLMQMVHLDREPSYRFNEYQVHTAARALEGWTRQGITSAGLAEAIRSHSRVGHVLERLQSQRRLKHPRVSGSRFLQAVAVACALPPVRALEVLEPLLAAGADSGGAVAEVALKVYMTGSAQPVLDAYSAIEAAGAVVVGEDHDWGDLYLRTLPSTTLGSVSTNPEGTWSVEELLNGLAGVCRSNGPASPTASISARAAWTAQEVSASGAQALLSVVREYDEAPAWDFPLQQHAMRARGIPALLLARQPAVADSAALADAVGQLIELAERGEAACAATEQRGGAS